MIPPPGAYDIQNDLRRYRDRGCWVAPSCLECPRELCVLEDPTALRPPRKPPERRNLAVELLAGGCTTSEIAAQMGIKRESVYRLLYDAGVYVRASRVEIREATHCPNGHRYTVANTRRNVRGHRICRDCERDQQREHRARLRIAS